MRQKIRTKTRRRFIGELLCIAVLAATPLEAYPAESKRSPEYCPKNDPKVRVHAEIKGLELIQRDESGVRFRAQVMINIANSSAEPVFILSGGPSVGLERDPYYGSVSLARAREDALSCRYIFKRGLYPGKDRRPYWDGLRKELDHETPSPRVIRTIVPGGNWEFEREILFGMWKDPWDDKHSLQEILSDPHAWLRVELLMWPNNLERDMLNPIFGMSLRERWKSSGHLIIENLWTEPVEVTLPLK